MNKRFFTAYENVYIMENKPTYRFYKILTKKESRIKFEGKGSNKPLNSFSVF